MSLTQLSWDHGQGQHSSTIAYQGDILPIFTTQLRNNCYHKKAGHDLPGMGHDLQSFYRDTAICSLQTDCRYPGFLKIQEEFGSFDAYIWGFVDGQPIHNGWQKMAELPAKTELSETISKDLKKRDFSFVGPMIIYAFMLAVGLINDHAVECFRYLEIRAMS